MADYRVVKVSMWSQDEWFMDLPADGKLLWIYLFTNAHTSAAGIYKLPLRTMAFETGLPTERCSTLLEQFEQDSKIAYRDSIVWVFKMRDHQANSSPKVKQGIARDVGNLPDTVLTKKYKLKYGMDTVSIPYFGQKTSGIDTVSIGSPEFTTETDPIQYDPIRSDTIQTVSLPENGDSGQSVNQSVSQSVAALLKTYGLNPTDYRIGQYSKAIGEYGLEMVKAGLTAASNRGQEENWKYVRGCIENIIAESGKPAAVVNGLPTNGLPPAVNGKIELAGHLPDEIARLYAKPND